MGYFSDYGDISDDNTLYGISYGDETEGERISDYDDIVYEEDEDPEYHDTVEENRFLRKCALVGKYIIVCDSKVHKGELRYLQDQTISNTFIGHWWTNYIENAKGYTDMTAAFVKCRNLKYNNPRVMQVVANCRLIECKFKI